jgi:hypothetical protein
VTFPEQETLLNKRVHLKIVTQEDNTKSRVRHEVMQKNQIMSKFYPWTMVSKAQADSKFSFIIIISQMASKQEGTNKDQSS